MKRSVRLALACLALLCTSAPVLAQPVGDKQKALELYEKGNVQYNLGRWKEAVEFFTQAYEAYSAPEFLFNIAQAHRQAGNCSDAVFFYRRYLANKPDAPNRSEVQGFIDDLEKNCKEGSGSGTTGTGTGTGTGTTTGTGTGTGTTGTTTGTGTGTTGTGTGTTVAQDTTVTGGTTDDDEVYDDEDGLLADDAARPSLFAASVAVGPSFLSAGNLETPVLFAFSIAGGYPIQVGEVQLEPGAVITYTPVPWEGDMEGIDGTAGLTGLLANAGAVYEVMPKLSVRGDLGAGLLVMSGLDQGTPFLAANEFADGAISMFHLRVALGAEYTVMPNLAVQLQPIVFSYAPAGALKDEISSLTRFEVLVGAAYKM